MYRGKEISFDHSSAWTRNTFGAVNPSALAVLRLMTNSKLVGDCTGNRPAQRSKIPVLYNATHHNPCVGGSNLSSATNEIRHFCDFPKILGSP